MFCFPWCTRGLGSVAPHRVRKDATAPGRAHGTGTVYKCAILRIDLPLVSGVQRFFRKFLRSRQAGKGNQELPDRLAVSGKDGGKHTLQNRTVAAQATGAGVALLLADSV